MVRYRFRKNVPYPGKLRSVKLRPIENRGVRYALLRFEFEIFVNEDDGKRFRSTGKIASRDLLVGAGNDQGIRQYADALHVDSIDEIESWTRCANDSHWVLITFDDTDPVDFRNPFASISRLDHLPTEIVDYEYDPTGTWMSVSEIADDLGMSAATVRRRLEQLEPIWGDKLVTRTRGGHRRICLPMLKNLL